MLSEDCDDACPAEQTYTPSHTSLDDIIATYNHTPQKCLGFQTPAKAFIQPLHFQCGVIPRIESGVTTK
mgnify:CR=1 FL=1